MTNPITGEPPPFLVEKECVGSQQINHERIPSESSATVLNKVVYLKPLLITPTNNSNNASLPTLQSPSNWGKMPE